MTPDQTHAFFAFALGFAIAGVLATGYQAATRRPVSFRLLERGPSVAAFAAIPLLAFAAPFVIMRNTIRVRAHSTGRFQLALIATIVAGLWSLMSGTVAVMALELIGLGVS
jgi:hypothetical protein